ncbi:YggT family protein [Alteromonas sp. McT4-15]|uniref:YggT family protein n=1 Tax=Alteromonas sp. McT4-15 TaxID=2881256 RepID=UPI0012E463CA|nr:YggT family protein [Alteromonas sp. McT4-15]MCB4435137.1 YggT family protein [Alteromonas sp. McT4-15]GFD90004.1 membrane protein [Tenacibaculum sp. KUL152]
MNATVFLIDTLFSLYLMVVILRLWLQVVQADFYNPLSQFVVKATHPIVGPLRRVIPSIGRFDTATFVLAVVVCALKIVTLGLMFGGNLNPLGVAILSVIGVIKETLSLMFWVLLLRAILSWVSQGRSPVDYVLHQLTEPFLAPIRRIIPPLGGLDLSVLIAIIALQFLQLLLQETFPFY